MDPGVTSFVDVLRGQAERRPDRNAFTFLESGETEADALTYAQLDHDARAVAAALQARTRAGERALLLYPPGLDFVRAFMGCLYAGVVAVPVYPPRRNRSLDRLMAVAADAQTAVALTNATVARMLARGDGGDLHTPVIVADRESRGDADAWRAPSLAHADLAFLQYTSGSTGTPKGVMITHGNLLHNNELIKVAYSHSPDSVFVSWLPVFHDMGLVGMVLQPIYTGSRSVLMEPAAFLQKPVRWLRAITRYRGTTSGAPNSAYELCVRKVSADDRASLDLGSWQFAYNGSEPVRASTIRRFHAAFEPCGLRLEAVQPCYGMAEATLLISIAGLGKTPTLYPADGAATVVSSGRTWLDERLIIVNPETCERCSEGGTGEIWIASGSVAAGYWNRPDETTAAFGARTAPDGDGPFFRTGDLGFVRGGQVFVTGRLKDLIIIRGRNLYPQDIEYTAGGAHAARRGDSAAAFAVASEAAEDGEQLVVVCEVVRERLATLNADEVLQAVRQAVAEEHEVDPAAIVLLRTLGLPKTSSGKVQRSACRERFLAGTLEVVAEWRRPAETVDVVPARAGASYDAIRDWLVATLAALAGVPRDRVNIRDSFSRYGLDSQRAVVLSGELQDWLGRPLLPTVAYDYPSIDALARHLADSGTVRLTPDTTYLRGSTTSDSAEPIAIVGMGCRFPGAATPEQFWTLLVRGEDRIAAAPASRPHAEALGLAGFLDGVEQFDAGFFGVTPREAEIMDPQQRLLLEVAWEAIGSAGITPERLAGSRTGVFVGISNLDYLRLQAGRAEASDPYAGTGNALSIAANRLSYFFDLRGPSWAVDTACSSSLVAVHQACESLRRGESEAALCGGVNLILSPQLTSVFTRAGMMSASHRCRAFDAGADGYVRGEGVAVIVLKRMSDARRDGDTIHALILGSAVNQDGRSNGLTAPNGPAQQAVIRSALEAAGIAPAQIGYVEAHGTGTPLGDPIEMNALMAVLGEDRPASQRCAVGSVKTNIGHLEAAAGIAGLLKVALLLRHGAIPPHLHFSRLNPHITVDGTPFVIPTAAMPWPNADGPRRAGVSSFGFGGTNAHVILEEPPAAAAAPPRVPAAARPTFERQRFWIDEVPAVPSRHDAAVRVRRTPPAAGQRITFGLMFFAASEDSLGPDKYRLVLDSARFADREGFSSVWVPERHFTAFGGLYPNPAVLHAAVAACTSSIRLNAGSVVAPLHHPLRIAEEWSVVDNLSNGRVGLSFASGWNPNDFIFFPERYESRHERVLETMQTVQRLWRGEPFAGTNGVGQPATVAIFPKPVQRELPAWLTVAGNPRHFERAGASGANLLTHLLDQDESVLASRIALYRHARAAAGFDPATGIVSLMIHTLVGADAGVVREQARRPYCEYIKANIGLFKGLAQSRGHEVDVSSMSTRDLDEFVNFLYDRFAASRGLIGTPESCAPLVSRLEQIGVNEVACLLDFGPQADLILENLPHLARLKDLHAGRSTPPPRPVEITRAPAPALEDAAPLLYERTWGPEAPAVETGTVDARGCWRVIPDRQGVAAELVRQVEAHGGTCVTAADDSSLRGIIYLGGLDAMTEADADAPTLDRNVQQAVGGALGAAQSSGSAPIWIVTRGAVPALEGLDPINVSQAPLWGFGRALAVERPGRFGALIDLDPAAPADEAARQLLQVMTDDRREDMVAVRSGVRYVPRLRRAEPTAARPAPLSFAAADAILVTGGHGGLGLRLIERLVERGARHLVLCSRRAPAASAAARLDRLRAAGVDVAVLTVDVSDGAALTAQLQAGAAARPPVTSVFHLAGVLDDGEIGRQTWARFADVMRSKVAGAWNLHRLTLGVPLKHFVLFSSVASLMPAPGQSSYAAANAFLDALAHYRRAQGLPALAVNWGPWSEAGHAQTEYGRQAHERLASIGIGSIAPDLGLRILDALLEQDRTQAAVVRVDWPRFFRADPAASRLGLLAELAGRTDMAPDRPRREPSALVEALMALPQDERRPHLMGYLSDMVIAALKLRTSEPLDPRRPLFEIGLDSIMALELKNQLERALGTTLSATLLFVRPTIDALSDYILTERMPGTPGMPATPRPAATAVSPSMSEEELTRLLLREIDAGRGA